MSSSYMIVVFLFSVFIQVHCTTHLHPVSSADTPALLEGHILLSNSSSLARNALHFRIFHKRSIFLFDHMHEDGIRLTSVEHNPVKGVVNLLLSGSALDVSDFVNPHTNASVLIIHSSYLNSPSILGKNRKHVYLSILSSSFNVQRSSVRLITKVIPTVSSVLSSVSFKPITAKLHPHASKEMHRNFHIYGTHSTVIDTSNRFFDFKFDPITICIASSKLTSPLFGFGFKPVTLCELELAGVVVNKTLPLPLSQPNSVGSVNSLLSVSANGTFNVTSDQIRFTIVYQGLLSASLKCPSGCRTNMPLMHSFFVPNYHRLVQTLDEHKFSIPELDGIEVQSSINVSIYSRFATRSNITTLKLSQPFNVTSEAPGTPAGLSVSSPRVEAIEINKLQQNGWWNGPWGLFTMNMQVKTKVRDSGSVIQNFVNVLAGMNLRTYSRDGVIPLPPKRYGLYSGVCDQCHRRRVRVYPFFRNLKGFVNSTHDHLGFNDTYLNMPIPNVRVRPHTVCMMATQCQS